MTEEEKREQVLKRALPALFITIIYFIFISDIMGDQAIKAQDDYTALMRKGISPAALPGVYRQQEQARAKLSKLKAEQAKYALEIKKMAGFVSADGNSMDTATDLANILAKHAVRVNKEVSEEFLVSDLPVALKEVRALLKSDTNADSASIGIQHLWLHASFNQVYAALAEMKENKLAAVPVELRMDSKDSESASELSWELLLWM